MKYTNLSFLASPLGGARLGSMIEVQRSPMEVQRSQVASMRSP